MGVRGGAPERPDDWWWLIVATPNDGVHLYELGYADVVSGVYMPLTAERQREILAELSGPPPEKLTVDAADGWGMELKPGRPGGRYLEPKAYDEGTGELGPIRAKPGVTLHLLEG